MALKTKSYINTRCLRVVTDNLEKAYQNLYKIKKNNEKSLTFIKNIIQAKNKKNRFSKPILCSFFAIEVFGPHILVSIFENLNFETV